MYQFKSIKFALNLECMVCSPAKSSSGSLPSTSAVWVTGAPGLEIILLSSYHQHLISRPFGFDALEMLDFREETTDNV